MKICQVLIHFDNLTLDSCPDPQKWDSSKTLILAFCSPSLLNHRDFMTSLKDKYPHSKVVGCSTSGEIYGPKIHDQTISLNFLKLDEGRFKIAVASVENAVDSKKTGIQLAKALAEPDLKGVFILSEGLKANGSALAEGLNSIFGSKVQIGGGLAGDGTAFRETFVVCDHELLKSHVLGVGFYGDCITIKSRSQGGWDIFGPERMVSRSSGNSLFELDGRPALDLYKEYLGEKSKDLPASALLFPLQISHSDHPDTPRFPKVGMPN